MKKSYSLLIAFPLLLILFLVSCQKERSIENAVINRGTAMYEFEGGTGPCTGATLSGTFTAGTAATAANTVTISVDVDSIGSYIITTNTLAGISFSASGAFTDKGVQTITLTASGTPAAAGVYDFTPVGSNCTFSVTVAANNGGTNGAAIYTLSGGTAACTGAVVSGTFTAGTATSAANTAVLNVQVNKIGTYTISSNTVNGIRFSGTGSFTTTGAQTVKLTATGTPTAAGSFAFTPVVNGCTFNITVAAGGTPGGGGGGTPGGGGGGSGNFLKCKIDGVLVNFNKSLTGYYAVPPSAGIPYSATARGINSDVPNSKEELWVVVTNPTAPTTGNYLNRTISMDMTDRASQVTFYPTGFPNPFWGVGIFNENTLTVNITTVSTSGATGTFQGTIYANNGTGPETKKITEGQFKITF